MVGDFTPQAQREWESIPEDAQDKLLANVFCAHCKGETTIVDFQGNIVKGDIRLTGSCKKCGGDVVRFIECQ